MLSTIEEYTDVLGVDIAKPTDVFDSPFDDCLVDKVVSYFGIQNTRSGIKHKFPSLIQPVGRLIK